MRFDDSLSTVLAADTGQGAGAQATWRQLVDLIGRGRVADPAAAIARLRALRAEVPLPVRSASARALAFARPGAELVALLATDELAVAAPVLRTVQLPAADWLDLLGQVSPAARAVLRGRRDLPATVERGLASLGPVDFVLSDANAVAPAQGASETIAAPAVPTPPMPPEAPLSPSPFVALGEVARGLPVVAEALRRADAPASPPGTDTPPPRFEIADIVARIDAFQRDRAAQPAVPVAASPEFHFVTDPDGVVRGVDGVARAPLVGLSLADASQQALAQVDAGVAAAVRRRGRFADARLEVGGRSDAAGSWRIAGVPDFDPATGRFTGYRGIARRPARHERAEPGAAPASDQLRQLVHELRTPANAVAGFAELIDAQLLGPVPEVHRARAAAIRVQAAALLAAIEDLDTAARMDAGALDLRPGAVALAPLIDRVVADLRPLAAARGALLAPAGERVVVAADDRAAERLLARLFAALVAAAMPGERIAIDVARRGETATIAVTRPRALADLAGEALFTLDDGAAEDDPLLGVGFTLRLVRNLAAELGGSLAIGADSLTLRLPVALDAAMGQASTR